MDGRAMRAVDAEDEINVIRCELSAMAQMVGAAGETGSLDCCAEGIALMLSGISERLGACSDALSEARREECGAEVLEMAGAGTRA